MKTGHSLRRLIVGRVLLIAFLYTACLFWVIDTEIGTLLAAVRSNILSSRLWEISSYIGKQDGRVMLNMPRVRTEFFSQPGVDFVVRSEGGKILFHSEANWVDITPPKTPDRNSIYEFEYTAADGDEFMGQSGWVTFDKTPYLVQVTQRKDVAAEFSDRLGRKFLYNVGMLAIPFMGLLVFSIMRSIRQSLKHVKASSQQAQDITFATPGQRLGNANLPKEILPLVDAFNTVLERLEAGIVAQKEFTAHAAHELRTPLSVLQAHIALLEDKELKEKLSTDVDTMGRLVEQLLAAARLEDSEALAMERTDIARICRETCLAIWPLMLKKHIKLDVTGIEKPVYVMGNTDSIARALRNVLENAFHHSAEGGVIEVALAGFEIRVRDHGPGIAQGDEDKIFQRFWRKNASEGSGAGLGLYIVRTTMKLHGGTVTVTNPEGGGACFTLAFPNLSATPAKAGV